MVILRNNIYRSLNAKIILVFFTILTLAVSMSQHASAQPSNVGGGITVSPGQVRLGMGGATLSDEETISITNSYDKRVVLELKLQGIDESGLRLIPKGSLDPTLQQGLKLSDRIIEIPAKKTVQVKLRVEATKDRVWAGGHYASLVITQLNEGENQGIFQSAVALTVFVVNSDGLRADLRLKDQSVRQMLFSLPSSVSLTFENKGNAHVVPRASVTFYDAKSGNVIASSVINSETKILFPGKQGTFKSSVQRITRPLLPVKIRMETLYRIDGVDVQLKREQFFWYVPAIVPISILMAGGLLYWQRKRIKTVCSRVIKLLPKRPSRPHKKKSPTHNTLVSHAASAFPADEPDINTGERIIVRVEKKTSSQSSKHIPIK